MKTTQEKPLIKLEIDDYTTLSNEMYEHKTSTDLKEIEFAMITPIDFSDIKKLKSITALLKLTRN